MTLGKAVTVDLACTCRISGLKCITYNAQVIFLGSITTSPSGVGTKSDLWGHFSGKKKEGLIKRKILYVQGTYFQFLF